MARPIFRKKIIGELINDQGSGKMNVLSCVGDINGDGKPDVVISGRNGKIAWFENKGASEEWIMHHLANIQGLECGGCVYDLTGNGFGDVLSGSDYTGDEMYWWENPGDFSDQTKEWKRHVIAKTGATQMHDTIIGEIKNDGVKYFVFTNQGSATTIYCVPIPSDPHQSPWPGLEIIASDKTLPNPQHTFNRSGIQPDEGLALGDVDNDGLVEIVCGISYYKWTGSQWEATQFTDRNYITNKILVADIDRDGKNEIIVSEGDAYIYGHDDGCKVAWFKPVNDNYKGVWKETIIDTGLLDAHSIAVADLCGNGYPDLFIGEIGAIERGSSCEDYIIRKPRMLIYENDGKGFFTARYIIDEGTGTHEAILIDLNGDGKLDIVGKPLHGDEQWKIHVWYREV